MKSNPQKAYDYDVASSYETHRTQEAEWNLENEYVEKFLRSIPKGSKIIDIPIGTGRFIPYYEELEFEVTGLDISQEMLDVASQKVRSDRIHLLRGDSQNFLLKAILLVRYLLRPCILLMKKQWLDFCKNWKE